MARSSWLSSEQSGMFGRSVSYLGSKLPILDFVMEAASRFVKSEDTRLLDAMCGSGVVAAASARLLCETYASDALEFCPNLAMALSSGHAADQTEKLRGELEAPYKENYRHLRRALHFWVSREARLLVMDPRSALAEYRSLVARFPRFPSDGDGSWNPRAFVERARRAPERVPYGLVTAYFANAYFGVRQSIELDSLRYAIDAISVGAAVRQAASGGIDDNGQ